MLALKDERHQVKGSVGGLAYLAGVTKEQCEAALKKFEGSDPDSSNPDYNGRKIEKCVGGWVILNGEFYQKMMSKDERREYQRVKQAEYRKKNRMLPNGASVASGKEIRQVREYGDGERSAEELADET